MKRHSRGGHCPGETGKSHPYSSKRLKGMKKLFLLRCGHGYQVFLCDLAVSCWEGQHERVTVELPDQCPGNRNNRHRENHLTVGSARAMIEGRGDFWCRGVIIPRQWILCQHQPTGKR